MYMMFVDESGDPGYPKDGNWKGWGGARFYARVGAIVHGHKWRAWNTRMEAFKKNHGLTWDAELRASAIRRGNDAFVGWDQPKREWFMKQVLELIGLNEDITLIGILIDKSEVDVSQRARIVRPEIRSLELLLERYNHFLHSQRDRSGIVVLDPVGHINDDNIRHFQSYLQVHSEHLKPLHIVEGTFFAKSHTSNMIQVADICTNVFYRKETGARGSSNEFSLINPRFYRCDGKLVGFGVKRWPKKKPPR